MDGRSAAADGTSKWISGPESRARVHDQRSRLDAIIVGTGTVLADDPWLTARLPDGELAPHQRCGLSSVCVRFPPLQGFSTTRRRRWCCAPTTSGRCSTRSAIDRRAARGRPRLAGAFLAAGCVDRIQAYLAPVVLGAGEAAVEDTGVGTISDALRFRRERVETVGSDILLTLVPDRDN